MLEPIRGAFAPITEVFRLPDLRRLAISNALGQIGFWAYGIAIGIYAFEVGGATLVGVAMVGRLVPSAILAPFMAVLTDRVDQRQVMIWTNFAQAVLIAGAAAGVAAGFSPVIVLTLAALVAVLTSAYEPAKNAIIPELVERPRQLAVANAAIASLESASMFIGPAIGGFALALGGVEETFILTCGFMAVALLLLLRISPPATPTRDRVTHEKDADEPGALRSALLGFPLVARDRNLRLMFVLNGFQFAVFGMLTVLLIALAIDELGIGSAGVGYLNSAIGVGGLLGVVALSKISQKLGLGATLAVGMVAWGLPIALVGLVPALAVAAVAMVLTGLANTVVDASTNTILQRTIPAELRGRVYGVLESIVVISIAAGSLFAPLLLAWLGIQTALVVTGLTLPVLTLVIRARLVRMDEEFKPPARLLELLTGSSIFSPLPAPAIERLADSLQPFQMEAGQNIVTQGEDGDLFYLISSGRVAVLEDGVRVRDEGPGDHFGEIALLRDSPRTATVRAITDVKLLALDREDFLEAVTRDPLSSANAEAIVAIRLGIAR